MQYIFSFLTLSSFWISLAALGPFRIGIWVDSGPVIIGLFILSGLIGLALLLSNDRAKLGDIFKEPLVKVTFSLALVSIITSVFSKNPQMSWMGSPALGIGVVYFLCAFILVSAYYALLSKHAQNYVIINLSAAASVIAVMNLFGHPSSMLYNWWPFPLFTFNAYLAYMGTAIIACASLYKSNLVFQYLWKGGNFTTSLSGGYKDLYRYVLIGFGILLIIYSDNKTTKLAIPIAALFVYMLTHLKISSEKRVRIYAAIFIAVLPVWILSAEYILSKTGMFSSLASRVHMIEIALQAFSDDKMALLVGFGWGSFVDLMIAKLSLLDVSLFNNAILAPTWDGLNKLDFTFHNFFLEAFISGGIFTAMLVVFLSVMPVLYSRSESLGFAIFCCILYTATLSTWFEMPTTLPFSLFMFVILMRPEDISHKMKDIKVSFGRGVLIKSAYAVAVLFSVSAGGVNLYLSYQHSLIRDNTLVSLMDKLEIPINWNLDRYLGGNYFAITSRQYLDELALSIALNEEIDPSEVEHVQSILGEYDAVVNPTVLTSMIDLTLYGDLFYRLNHPSFEPLRSLYDKVWAEKIAQVYERAPNRSDLLFPFLTWKLSKEEYDIAQFWVDQLLKHNPKDPVGLWFKGMLLIRKDKSVDQGREQLVEAYVNGVGRLIPITYQEIKRSFTS